MKLCRNLPKEIIHKCWKFEINICSFDLNHLFFLVFMKLWNKCLPVLSTLHPMLNKINIIWSNPKNKMNLMRMTYVDYFRHYKVINRKCMHIKILSEIIQNTRIKKKQKSGTSLWVLFEFAVLNGIALKIRVFSNYQTSNCEKSKKKALSFTEVVSKIKSNWVQYKLVIYSYGSTFFRSLKQSIYLLWRCFQFWKICVRLI